MQGDLAGARGDVRWWPGLCPWGHRRLMRRRSRPWRRICLGPRPVEGPLDRGERLGGGAPAPFEVRDAPCVLGAEGGRRELAVGACGRAAVAVIEERERGERRCLFMSPLRALLAPLPTKLWWTLLQSLADIARLDPRPPVRAAGAARPAARRCQLSLATPSVAEHPTGQQLPQLLPPLGAAAVTAPPRRGSLDIARFPDNINHIFHNRNMFKSNLRRSI